MPPAPCQTQGAVQLGAGLGCDQELPCSGAIPHVMGWFCQSEYISKGLNIHYVLLHQAPSTVWEDSCINALLTLLIWGVFILGWVNIACSSISSYKHPVKWYLCKYSARGSATVLFMCSTHISWLNFMLLCVNCRFLNILVVKIGIQGLRQPMRLVR